jgi:hypothetical protein
MQADPENANEQSALNLTFEEADRLVTEAIDTDIDEPEPLVKLLLILYDRAQPPDLKDAIHHLMKAAYHNSIVQSINFQEYLEAIREGRNVVQEARTRWYGDKAPED